MLASDLRRAAASPPTLPAATPVQGRASRLGIVAAAVFGLAGVSFLVGATLVEENLFLNETRTDVGIWRVLFSFLAVLVALGFLIAWAIRAFRSRGRA